MKIHTPSSRKLEALRILKECVSGSFYPGSMGSFQWHRSIAWIPAFAGMTTLLCILFISIAHAQTPISNDMADQFFTNCLDKRDERMSTDTQGILCQCTALHMQKNLDFEDIGTMAQPTQAGRDALNKMLMLVYAPCMEFPVRDLIYDRCMENKFQAQQGICTCLADKMGKFTAQSAQKTLGKVLSENPNIADPMAPIVNSPEFQRMEKRLALDCVMGQ